MSHTELLIQFSNLKPIGIELLSSFIKRILVLDSEKRISERKFSPFDGYQLALISINLNTYNRVNHSIKSLQINPSEKDSLFVESIEALILEQVNSLTQAFSLFKESLEGPLKEDSKDNFIDNLFLDFSVYTGN